MSDEHTPDDPLPALIAEIDQMIAVAPQVARAAFGFYTSFKLEGFSDSQAVYMTAVQLKGTGGPSS